MNEFESDWISLRQRFVQNGWIQDGRIPDGCHHQVEWEWMSLSQIELVSVRVRVEGECFWVNLREDNKVSESKMTISESNMAEFKMAAIIKLSQNEWVKVIFVQMVGTNLGKCEWVWEEKLRCLDAPIYLDDVWMPPVHTQHKERILCQRKEVSTCPHTSACPLYINNTKKACFVRLRGCPYTRIHLDATICLDTTCMLGCHLYV